MYYNTSLTDGKTKAQKVHSSPRWPNSLVSGSTWDTNPEVLRFQNLYSFYYLLLFLLKFAEFGFFSRSHPCPRKLPREDRDHALSTVWCLDSPFTLPHSVCFVLYLWSEHFLMHLTWILFHFLEMRPACLPGAIFHSLKPSINDVSLVKPS